MKRALLVLLLVAVAGGLIAANYDTYTVTQWSHTMVAADTTDGTGVNRDTVNSETVDLHDFQADINHLWFGVEILDKDTVLRDDSVIVEFQYSHDGALWRFFDSLQINTTSTNDTFVMETTRFNTDSVTGAHGRYLRARFYIDYELLPADTTIVGNTYTQNHKLWIFPRY